MTFWSGRSWIVDRLGARNWKNFPSFRRAQKQNNWISIHCAHKTFLLLRARIVRWLAEHFEWFSRSFGVADSARIALNSVELIVVIARRAWKSIILGLITRTLLLEGLKSTKQIEKIFFLCVIFLGRDISMSWRNHTNRGGDNGLLEQFSPQMN